MRRMERKRERKILLYMLSLLRSQLLARCGGETDRYVKRGDKYVYCCERMRMCLAHTLTASAARHTLPTQKVCMHVPCWGNRISVEKYRRKPFHIRPSQYMHFFIKLRTTFRSKRNSSKPHNYCASNPIPN
jgi:hypothetical protein